MSASTASIVVGVDGSTGSEVALRWALNDAETRKAPVRIVCCHQRPVLYGWEAIPFSEGERLDRAAEEYAHGVVAEALEHAHEIAPHIDVTGETVLGAPAGVLADLSMGAERAVVGSRQLKAFGSALLGSVGAGLSARARCPVVVVRGPSGPTPEGAAVVVGIDGSDPAEHAVEFGFDHANRHALPLSAVVCWRPDPLVTKQWQTEVPVPERAQAWISDVVARWKERYPSVSATGIVVQDHPVAGLVAQSAAQHLLVVRSRTRSALAGTLLGSVTQGVLHHATCPVAVIPAAVD